MATQSDQTPVPVLVVDDSEVARQAMCEVVAATPGFEVVGDATSGREAIALVGALDADLVLLDVRMPVMDGIETARRIRRQYPDVAVLLLTATHRTQIDDATLSIEDKRDLSSRRLAEFWQQHGRRP